jgi:hypothetical protein
LEGIHEREYFKEVIPDNFILPRHNPLAYVLLPGLSSGRGQGFPCFATAAG